MQKGTIVSINLGNFGSTGRIADGIADAARKAGYTYYTAYPPARSNTRPAGEWDIVIGWLITRRGWEEINKLVGLNGCYAWLETALFLRKLDRIKPDALHLHNLHNCYINLPMLFSYCKRRHIRVVWTLHDCWAFTGQCTHFLLARCERWKTGCGECPQFREYPSCQFDRTRLLYRLKRRWFTGVENLTIVTPSHWLAGLVRQSFLNAYPVRVIPNGIDLAAFTRTESGFRVAHGLEGKFVLLGASYDWGYRKGLDVFIELDRRLDDAYRIVLVGTNEETDRLLPDNIISIHRTQNRRELAEIYSAADLFVNPTREENFPTVNMEALSCGTPVITFDTGGSPEIPDETCGRATPWSDIDAMEAGIRDVYATRPYAPAACRKRAERFDAQARYAEYVALYAGMAAGKKDARGGDAF